ncbi:MAG: hypothetical protein ACF788_07345 [Novipirellula sp. JB048]
MIRNHPSHVGPRFAARACGMLCVVFIVAVGLTNGPPLAAQNSKFAHSDSQARYIHHIDLYDIHHRKITPESDQPYSSLHTCGRCHDYETISHGWHFNAFMTDTADGRGGEPWIWTDPRTGTQLPLSYRDWEQTFDPKDLGISSWEMTHQFGSRVPGGGFADAADAESTTEDAPATPPGRWHLSGSLQIDCMVCHASSGVYDFNSRREQIENQNFAWAATAGIRLGTIEGNVSRLKDDADPSDPDTQQKLPKVAYDPRRFEPDGTVFMDLVRQPTNNACYQCHSQQTVTEQGIELRWVHDQDVHLRAGMQCVDCHRNGIEHHITRGFEGEQNPSPVGTATLETLSCSGCHLGTDSASSDSAAIASRPGRLGAPFPHHAGLPPVHFEKLSCTACHAGPLPREEAIRIMTSLAHSLGSKDNRTGAELPAIAGPVYRPQEDGKIYPQRAVWPAYWGTLGEGEIEPLDPSTIFDLTRRSLRVRRNFVDEIITPKLSSKVRREILGEERARLPETELTADELEELAAAQQAAGRESFNEKVSASLAAIEQELEVETAVYVSSGFVYRRGEEQGSLEQVPRDEIENTEAIEMLTWPIAHNVRPAGWSLGSGGCTECHSETSAIFTSTVQSIGPGPDHGERVTMASLQGLDPAAARLWNQLFAGRDTFKYIMATSLAVLGLTLLVGVAAWAARRIAGPQHPA